MTFAPRPPLLSGTALPLETPRPRLALPPALCADEKPATFDLAAAQHNLRKAFLPSR